ncbi:OmpA family protein [Pseudomarimonas arenosa]|uniref:OmpA family protein n=1 Tax=Pseudomarimonas arenosa TaxID=2774145 RepID=A0AAW3ZS89_9GAMM|nr:OmpA family protein [Pseudomarimonas arenosa]MBD8527429.1 OmpA family protein [Pseudomarimonas arenosa]
MRSALKGLFLRHNGHVSHRPGRSTWINSSQGVGAALRWKAIILCLSISACSLASTQSRDPDVATRPLGETPPSHYRAWIAADASESQRRMAFDARIAARDALSSSTAIDQDDANADRADADAAVRRTTEFAPRFGTEVEPTTQWETALLEVTFDRGQSVLARDMDALLQLAKFLRRHPGRSIRIIGHTDSSGPQQSNYLLSERRAHAVRDYLLMRGIDPSRIFVVAQGSQAPAADNGSKYGRELNRRAEVFLLND